MIEYPSFFSADSQEILIYCPQRRSADDKVVSSIAVYKLLTDCENINLDENFRLEDAPRIHCLTLPRKVSLNNGKLYQKPIRELYGILADEILLHIDKNFTLGTIPRIFYANIKLNDAAGDFLLQIGDELELTWDKNGGEIAMSARLFAQTENFAINITCQDSNADVTVRRLNIGRFMTGGEFDD